MNRIMAFMKSNVATVVLCSVIVVSLPGAFIGSRMWNGSIKSAREKEANDDLKALTNARVTYVIPPVVPGGPTTELPVDAPNESATRWFREQRGALDRQVKEVVDRAVEINKAGHTILVNGLFPEPSATESVNKRLDLTELITGKERRPSVYVALLNSINAGMPTDSAKVAAALQDLAAAEDEKFIAEAGGGAKMTPEQREAMRKKLIGYRIGEAQRRAGEISVYAGLDCLPPQVPRAVPVQTPETEACFEMQWDYWVISDLIRAVGEANKEAGGGFAPVDRSVVKRIASIRLDPLPYKGSDVLANDSWTPQPGAGSEKAPLDPSESITGRRSSRHNTLYDVRNATLSVVVSSARLADLINAISRTNFMTVIDLDLTEVEPWKDLDLGFYYGSDHVILATLKIETIWLRSWTQPSFPARVALGFGIGEPPPEEGLGAATEIAPAPPAGRRGGQRTDPGDDLDGRRGRGGGG